MIYGYEMDNIDTYVCFPNIVQHSETKLPKIANFTRGQNGKYRGHTKTHTGEISRVVFTFREV